MRTYSDEVRVSCETVTCSSKSDNAPLPAPFGTSALILSMTPFRYDLIDAYPLSRRILSEFWLSVDPSVHIDREMAVETPCSPRISFSYNLCQPDPNTSLDPRVPCSTLLDSVVDFEFSVSGSSDLSHSSADEIFSNGEILAVGVKRPGNLPAKLRISEPINQPNSPSPPPEPQPRAVAGPTPSRLVEIEEPEERPNRHSPWRFVRSRSSSSASPNQLPSLCFFPLMRRSHSTGSNGSSSKASDLSDQKDTCRKPSPLPLSKKKISALDREMDGVEAR